jgi:hypothetical protein
MIILAARWKRVVGFKSRPLYYRLRSRGIHWLGGWVAFGPSLDFWEYYNFLPLSGKNYAPLSYCRWSRNTAKIKLKHIKPKCEFSVLLLWTFRQERKHLNFNHLPLLKCHFIVGELHKTLLSRMSHSNPVTSKLYLFVEYHIFLRRILFFKLTTLCYIAWKQRWFNRLTCNTKWTCVYKVKTNSLSLVCLITKNLSQWMAQCKSEFLETTLNIFFFFSA